MLDFGNSVALAARLLEGVGVLAIILGAVVATIAFAVALRSKQVHEAYVVYRQDLGRAILLGLELLVAADIIRTVAVSPTLGSVAVLAVIVLIRTFLSMTLELEITGKWPWQQGTEAPPRGGL